MFLTNDNMAAKTGMNAITANRTDRAMLFRILISPAMGDKISRGLLTLVF